MPSTITSAFGHWRPQVLAAIDASLDPALPVRAPSLGETLAAFARWPGCPLVHALMTGDPAAYRRIALIDPKTTGYSALLIRWPAGYVTDIHDHDGLWGIELVLDGLLQVEAFALAKAADAAPHAQDVRVLGIGDHTAFAGVEYAHRCRNLSATRPALSLHVYGGDLRQFRSFHADPSGRWGARTRQVAWEPALT